MELGYSMGVCRSVAPSGGATPNLALRQAYSTYAGNTQTAVSVTTGDLIIVGFCYGAVLGTITCSDNSSGGTNTYNQCGSGANVATTSAHLFYAIAKATETLTITCTSKTDNGIHVHVVSGAAQSLASVLDQYFVKGDSTAGASKMSGSITNTNANDYVICFWSSETAANTATDNGTGFTKQTERSNHYSSTFDRIVPAVGTYSNAITLTTSTNAFASVIASFKAGP